MHKLASNRFAYHVVIPLLVLLATDAFGQGNSRPQTGAAPRTVGNRSGIGQDVTDTDSLESSVSNDDVGTVTTGRRFQRENRRGEFVGSDASEQQEQGFTGAVQADTGAAVTTAPTVIDQSVDASSVNAAQTQTQTRSLYRAPLVIGFDVPSRPAFRAADIRTEKITSLINRSPALRGSNLSVSMDGRTAVLSGQVATAKQARLAELMLQMEPGVGRVENRTQAVDYSEVPQNGPPSQYYIESPTNAEPPSYIDSQPVPIELVPTPATEGPLPLGAPMILGAPLQISSEGVQQIGPLPTPAGPQN